MTIRFAAARSDRSSALARALGTPEWRMAANDNTAGPGRDQLLRNALEFFAQHGLGAAERARENAEAAFFDNRREEYRLWLNICQTLDRRMAAAVAVRKSSGAASGAESN